MHWLIFAAISVIVGSCGNIVRRRMMSHDASDPMIVAVLFQIGAGILTGSYALLHGFHAAPIVKYWPNYIIMTIGWTISTYCVYVVYKYIEAGEATLLGSLSSVVSIFGGVYVLHEIFSFQNVIGVIFILAAVVIIALENMKHFKVNKGFYYAIASSLFAGIAIINDTYMLRASDGPSQLALAFLIPGILLLLLQFKKVVFTLHHHKRDFWGRIVLQSTLSSISAGSYYIALDIGAPASQLSPIGQSSIIFTVILGMVFLGERKHVAKKLTCAGLVFIGVLLLG
ncbi:hypothetical protein BH09PAT2_BH09PAT2_07760 [soil metagenome]